MVYGSYIVTFFAATNILDNRLAPNIFTF